MFKITLSKLVKLFKTTPFKPALVVIDMQHDFVHGSLAVADAPAIIEPINKLLELPFVIKIGSKDFHPPDHISFASKHNKDLFSKITIYPPEDVKQEKGLEQVLWPDHCVQGTLGVEFVEGLNDEAFHAVVQKGLHPGIESYSAFRDPWHIETTELPGLLKDRGITHVYLVGVAGDYCVKSTAVDAVEFGFKTHVIRDAVRSVGKTGEEWKEMKKKKIQIVTSAQVTKRLSQVKPVRRSWRLFRFGPCGSQMQAIQ
ncbi:Isochorismatase hydrolase [Pluteus cervinus]|uniref:Isochorismatase hydrolase n=1 Tax=Pluteus cervinus TaxID=181527 RepID=A0ACD3B9F9_9AGAR|nr:Isochorismatase hydrolase [Pluteus cervinus]